MKPPQALVTGGAKRIGRYLVENLAAAGWDIALHYNQSRQEAEAVAAYVRSLGRQCQIFQCQLEDLEAVSNFIPDLYKQMDNLQLLVNSASIYEAETFREAALTSLERNFSVHVKAPWQFIQDFAHLYQKGHVVNIVDAAYQSFAGQYFPYLLSKKSLMELTFMCARELAPHIRVNAIAPGPICPPCDEQVEDDCAYMQERAPKQLLQMAGDPKYVYKALTYLLDNEYVTGQCLYVDGGNHLR